MIWIATICLLALFSWFLFNGLNERRWVESHQHDENVSTDQGLFPTYSKLSRAPMPEGGYSIHKTDSSVGRFAMRAKEKTAKLGEVVEQKAAALTANKQSDSLSAGGSSEGKRSLSEIGASLVGDGSMIGRTSDKLSKKAIEIGKKVPVEKLKPKNLRNSSSAASEPSGSIGRAIKKISTRIEEIDRKVD